MGLRPSARPIRLLPPAALADRLRRLARGRATAPARRNRDRRGPRPAPAGDPPVPPARERGRDRHRPGCAVGLGRGAGRRAGTALGRAGCSRSSSSGSSWPPCSCRADSRSVLPATVLVLFAVTSVLAWDRMIGAPEDAVFAGGLERAWIDDRLPADASVTKLYLESEACPTSARTRHALFLTEFFNSTVDRAAYIGDSIPDGLPIDRVEVEDGLLTLPGGEPLVADYVFTQPGIELDGAAARGPGRPRVSSSGRRAARSGSRTHRPPRRCGRPTARPRPPRGPPGGRGSRGRMAARTTPAPRGGGSRSG